MDKHTLSVKSLQEKLNEHQPIYILDIRPQDQREEWHIAGSHHKDIYDDIKSNNFSALDAMDFPEETPVVTVCAAGRTSLIASKSLRKRGIKAFSLEGGMNAWNFAWNEAELMDDDFKIIQIRRVAKGCLSYIVGSLDKAIVVDASLDPEVYLAIAKEHGWNIRYVMDTHIHADYLSRTRELASKSSAEHIFTESAKVGYPFTPFKDGEKITFGNVQIEFLHTPGHTLESASYLVNGKVLLTGDTLFTDGVGRPDLKSTEEEAALKAGILFDSLQRIKKLSLDTLILPAHCSYAIEFDEKIITETLEKLQNGMELLNLSREAFIKTTLTRIPPTPPNYLTIANLNKKGSFDDHQRAELEAGANRCAVL